MKKIMLLLLCLTPFFASATSVAMSFINKTGVGYSAGTIKISTSKYGMVFTPNLQGLTPGMHGFHIHKNPSCLTQKKNGKIVPGLAAGGHYDPKSTNKHSTPWGNGHLGDLPPLFVDAAGSASQAVLAPRLQVTDLNGRALMIHAGGDNHSDHPKKLGGGGARVVCGVIKYKSLQQRY